MARRTLRGKSFDNRDQKSQRLASTSLCCGEYVSTFQRGRYGGRLNRRRISEMELCQLLLEPGRQGHVFELCQTIFFLGEASREEVRRSRRPRMNSAVAFAGEMGGGRVAKLQLKPL